jgi:proteasome lid subunit RPN8/RPN11
MVINSMNIDDLRQKLIKYAESSPTKEVCGLVVYSREDELDIVKMENSAKDKEHFFVLDPAVVYFHDHHTVGIFHSHVSADEKPSSFDEASCYSCNREFFIYSLLSKKFHVLKPSTHREDVGQLLLADGEFGTSSVSRFST